MRIYSRTRRISSWSLTVFIKSGKNRWNMSDVRVSLLLFLLNCSKITDSFFFSNELQEVNIDLFMCYVLLWIT